VLAWLVAAALAVAEVSGMLSSVPSLVLAASEYAVLAPVSVGTALGKVELGAAGSFVGWTLSVGTAMAVCFVRAIGGSNQKFGIRSLYMRQVDHSGTRSLISVGIAKFGLMSLHIVPHSPVVGTSVYSQPGQIGSPTGSHRA